MACAYYTTMINVNNNNVATAVSKHNKGIAVTKMTASNEIYCIKVVMSINVASFSSEKNKMFLHV